ncbi:MAG: maltose alpha-D-glucosyltransferase [Acidimicrobiia bacterium]|nr:maltose alpha-D-glucosyltransferase [Acidimicrobiia bacterium]
MWYKTAVFYEIPVHTFYDSNGDGIGDLAGVTAKLDYLEWLGVDCLWLLPFYPSPMVDGGYDVSDLTGVRAEYGSLGDVQQLLTEAHSRGMKVIADMVMNHTSDQHPWFQESRQPGSPKRDWYVWSDTTDRYADARVIFIDSLDSNWTWDETAGAYFWHRFYPEQPDLNFDNPHVRKAVIDAVRFWLELGFDGLRLDAIPYLFEREGTNCENLAETHAFLKELRAAVDAEFDDRMLLAEANQPPVEVVDYLGDGDECHMAYHFPMMPPLYMALRREHVGDIIDAISATPEIPPSTQWGLFLRNHDELTLEMVTEEDRQFMYREYAPDPRMKKNVGIRRRLAPLLDNDRRQIELLHAILLSLPGSPFLYYGDELGMGDEYLLRDRDGVRTPMQWEPGPRAGFSTADPETFSLPIVATPGFGSDVINVADQREDETSLLHRIRLLLETRRRLAVFGTGDFDLQPSSPEVLAFVRSDATTSVFVAANVSSRDISVSLPSVSGQIVSGQATDAFSGVPVPDVLDLGPRQFRWIHL